MIEQANDDNGNGQQDNNQGNAPGIMVVPPPPNNPGNNIPQMVPLDPQGQPNIAMMAGYLLRMGNLHTIEDPAAMQLTPAETDRALAIRRAVQANDRLQPMCDFEYAQYALTATDLTLEQVVEKIWHLQQLRLEYNLLNTIQDGVQAFDVVTRQHPNSYLAVEYLPEHGNLMFIHDWAAFLPHQQITTPQHQRNLIRGEYYRLRLLAPTLRSIRVGFSCLIECEGVTRHNISFDYEQLITEVHSCRLEKWKECMFLNTPLVVNVAASMWKRFLSGNQKAAVHLGYQVAGFEGRRVSDLLLQPTPERARQFLLRNVELFLTARDRNERSFRLPPDEI